MGTVVDAVTALVSTKQPQGITVTTASDKQLCLTLPETHQLDGGNSIFVNTKPRRTLWERVDDLLSQVAPKPTPLAPPCSSSDVLVKLSTNTRDSDVESVGPRSRRGSGSSNGSNGKPKTKEGVKAATTTRVSKAPRRRVVDQNKLAILKTIHTDASDTKWHGRRSWWGQTFSSTHKNKGYDKANDDCPTAIAAILHMFQTGNWEDADSIDLWFTTAQATINAAVDRSPWFRGKEAADTYTQYQTLISERTTPDQFKPQ